MRRFFYLVATGQARGWVIPIVKCVLWVLSQVYLALIILRRALYRAGALKRYRLSVPVISVGNLTMGGVGKTPLVELIAEALKNKGIQPVILMRGYMRGGAGGRSHGSDEAVMLKGALIDVPVLVGADRVRNAKEFVKERKVDVFLLDDGFQHWRLSRDTDIVAIDATDPWGNDYLIPRGVLREPKSALRRADIFVLTKSDFGAEQLDKLKNYLKVMNPKALIVEAVHKPVLFSDLRSGQRVDLASLQGRPVSAVSGIGAPISFVRTLEKLGMKISENFAFMDHHAYTPGDLDHIIKLCRENGITTVVTTEKDAVKLKRFLNMFPDDVRVLSLKIKISIVNNEEQFFERISHIL